jgi:hypothetical protein
MCVAGLTVGETQGQMQVSFWDGMLLSHSSLTRGVISIHSSQVATFGGSLILLYFFAALAIVLMRILFEVHSPGSILRS